MKSRAGEADGREPFREGSVIRPAFTDGLEDRYREVLDLANRRVRMICPDGRRRTVSLFEARLIELASPRCRRRLMCEDFIRQVRWAAGLLAERTIS